MIILSLYNTICQEMYYAAFFDLVAMVILPHFRSLRRLVVAAVVALVWIYLVLYTRHRHTKPVLHSIAAWLQPWSQDQITELVLEHGLAGKGTGYVPWWFRYCFWWLIRGE